MSSVWRVERRFWKGFGQAGNPARRMIRLSCFRRYCVAERYRLTTNSVPGSAASNAASTYGRSSGKIGTQRDS